MTDLRKAAEMALDALDAWLVADVTKLPIVIPQTENTVFALRQALAQPETFKPDWDMIQPFHERIKELEIENEKLRQALAQPEQEQCICHRCIKENDLREGAFPLSATIMILCPECGNKRCPKASDHRLACSGSNESGQKGSVYTAQPEQEHKPWCDYLNIMLTSMPPQKAKCNCKQAQSEQEKLCKYCFGIGRVVCDGRCII